MEHALVLIGLVLLVLLGLVLLAAFICCHLAFWVQRTDGDPFAFPRGSQYAPYRAEARQLVEDALAVPYRDVWTQSPDGLQLHGKFYDAAPDAPIMLMLHGYKSTAERDFCGGLREAQAAGFRVLLADQRAHGRSAGKYLTFGIREREDCGPGCSICYKHTDRRRKFCSTASPWARRRS